MNRLITDIRCACGLLGCATVAAAVSFGAITPAQAASTGSPVPIVCRQAEYLTGWYAEICKEAWREMRASNRGGRPSGSSAHRPVRKGGKTSAGAHRTSGKPVPRARTQARAASPGPGARPSAPPTTGSAIPKQDGTDAQGLSPAPSNQPLPPVLLLGLLGLLIPAAAIGFTVRHRGLAAAAAGASLAPPADLFVQPADPPVVLSYQAVIDPFAGPPLGLTGPGAVDTARFAALTALETPGDSVLVVIPRSDATLLFGLGDDELLDDSMDRLFIPGSLDAALAYLETELTVRRETVPDASAPRLLLVADCEKDADRIGELLARHAGDVSAVILGDWPHDQVVIDGDGLVTGSPALAGRLPERVPAMSRTEARDRLTALIDAGTQPRRRMRRNRR